MFAKVYEGIQRGTICPSLPKPMSEEGRISRSLFHKMKTRNQNVEREKRDGGRFESKNQSKSPQLPPQMVDQCQ